VTDSRDGVPARLTGIAKPGGGREATPRPALGTVRTPIVRAV
jgi:hypothetical protein